jgi:predicted O-methyltransferase YrrM
MKRFLKDPDACKQPGNPVVIDLIYGWGNESWSAPDEYLTECIHHALTSRGPILECGSGLSTLLIGAIAKKRGQSHWALEHKPEWATKVKRYLNKFKLDSVVLCANSLKDYGNFCWYDAPLESMPDSFFLVVCDGPPADTKGGRYGLVPIMRERLKPGCIILLDDADREEELAIARRWQAEIGASLEILGSKNPYIEMTVGGPATFYRRTDPGKQAAPGDAERRPPVHPPVGKSFSKQSQPQYPRSSGM